MNYFRIITELTSFCNFNCEFCFQNQIRKNLKLGFVSSRNYKKIIDSVFNSEVIDNICLLLTWRGEALLHPDFIELFEYAFYKGSKSSKLNLIGLNTNSSLFTSDKVNKLIKIVKKFDNVNLELVFSLDAINKKTFLAIKNSPLFENVYNNVTRFTKNVISHDIKNVMLRYQFLLNENSYNEAKSFYNYWIEFFDEFNIIPSLYFDYDDEIPISFSDSRFRIFFHKTDIFGIEEKKKADLLHAKLKNYFLEKYGLKKTCYNDTNCDCKSNNSCCKEPFETLSIGINGDVSLCCKDIYGELTVGNILNDGLDNIIKSDKSDKIRKVFLKNKNSSYDLCRNCGR